MLLERTIAQLDVGETTPERALELGRLGYMQWLGSAPATADYRKEAMRSHDAAVAFADASPAIAVFCDLLLESIRIAPMPLPLQMPERQRRGGSRARRIVF